MVSHDKQPTETIHQNKPMNNNHRPGEDLIINKQLDKMFLSRLVHIVITLLIIIHLTTAATLTRIEDSVNIIDQDVVLGYQNDPLIEVKCPIEKMTIPYDKENARVWREKLLDYINITWYKDGLPFERENGNMFTSELDRLKLILYQISSTDEGSYSCIVDYDKVPPDIAGKFQELIGEARQYIQYQEPDPPSPRPEFSQPPPEVHSLNWLWCIPIIIGVIGFNAIFFACRIARSGMLPDKKPSSPSPRSDTTLTDQGSISWGKFSAQLYSPNSHSIATAPLYDQPPSTGTFRPFGTFIDNAYISNPSYGFPNTDNDTTEFSFPRRNLQPVAKIGEGQFGEVWRCLAHSKDATVTIVAVKSLKDHHYGSKSERSELRAEIDIMKAVNKHPNVIKLLNCCIDDSGPILLIMEYAENGTLQNYLRECRADRRRYLDRRDVTSKELIKFTYHIAEGMKYVASQGIVHRDLASRNILVSKDMICKVADFGLARRLDGDCAYVCDSSSPVPVKWMAPETLVEKKFTHESDIFSLAVLMWEIVTLGATPYEQLKSEDVIEKVTAGGRLDKPAHCKDELFALMNQCWSHDPALRPTFEAVALELDRLLQSGDDYIVLEQYPENAYYNIVNTAEKEVVRL